MSRVSVDMPYFDSLAIPTHDGLKSWVGKEQTHTTAAHKTLEKTQEILVGVVGGVGAGVGMCSGEVQTARGEAGGDPESTAAVQYCRDSW